MRHDKTARPTLRLLQEDLRDQWSEVFDRRAASNGKWDDLHPFAGVGHPIVTKCAEQLGDEPDADMTTQVIGCSGKLRLTEVSAGQWRAGVWTDSNTGVRWIVAAGLAKGNHRDHNDFYQDLEARLAAGGSESLKPSEEDYRLLSRETIARAYLDWELSLQSRAEDLLHSAMHGEGKRTSIPHPVRPQRMGEMELTYEVVDDCEEMVLEFFWEERHRSSNLGWQTITRMLRALWPPEQDWDRFEDGFSLLLAEGSCREQLERLSEENSRRTLIDGQPGQTSHYTHKKHLTERTVNGSGVRAVCGVFFVPMQDHEKFPECPACSSAMARIDREAEISR